MKHTTAPLLEGSILAEQKDLEAYAVQEGVARYRRLAEEATRRGEAAALKPVERLMLHWFEAAVTAIRGEQRSCRRGEPGIGRNLYAAPILLIDAERLAVITMHEMLGQCLAHRRVTVVKLAHAIGRDVLAEKNLELLRKNARDSLRELDRRCRQVNPLRVNWWAKRTLDDPCWNRKVCTQLGNQLMWLLIGVASADNYDKPFKL